MANNMIINFGKKYKGKEISSCDDKYLKWLISHERVLALKNRWASYDARFELERREMVAAPVAQGNSNWNEWEQAMQGETPAPVVVEHKPTWNHERCCYVWSDTGELVRDDEKPKYNVVSLSNERKERFDLVGYISRKAEGKRNLVAECREIKSRKRTEDLGQRGSFGSKPFSILR